MVPSTGAELLEELVPRASREYADLRAAWDRPLRALAGATLYDGAEIDAVPAGPRQP